MLQRTWYAAAALAIGAVSSGCATVTTGLYQVVTVESSARGEPLLGAACRLRNNKGEWFVRTPGMVPVHRSYQDMKVSCTHDDHEATNISVPSTTKPVVLGNIIIGGLVGVGVDIGTGSAYDYPVVISVEFGVVTMPAPAASDSTAAK